MDIQVQSFLNSATKLTLSVTSSTTVNQLKTLVYNTEGVTTTIMAFYFNNTELANTATLASINVTTGTFIGSSNNISSTSTWTKQQRQLLKLDLAQLRRKAAGITTATFYRYRNTYDITELPTTFIDNTATFDNPNIGGLMIGRPWGSSVPPPQNGLTLWLDAGNISSYSGSGATWTDLSSPADNITLVGSPIFTSTNPEYFTFNGTTQSGSGSGNTVPSTAYSKVVWFYLNAVADNNLLSSSDGGHYMFFGGTNQLWVGNANIVPYTGAGAFGSNVTFTTATWYMAAVTFTTSTGIKLYVNDVLDNSDPAYTTAHTGNSSTNIARFGVGNFLNGRIAYALAYNREITLTEVKEIYNSTRERFGY